MQSDGAHKLQCQGRRAFPWLQCWASPGSAMEPASMPKDGSLMGSPGFLTSGALAPFTAAGAPPPWNSCTSKAPQEDHAYCVGHHGVQYGIIKALYNRDAPQPDSLAGCSASGSLCQRALTFLVCTFSNFTPAWAGLVLSRSAAAAPAASICKLTSWRLSAS